MGRLDDNNETAQDDGSDAGGEREGKFTLTPIPKNSEAYKKASSYGLVPEQGHAFLVSGEVYVTLEGYEYIAGPKLKVNEARGSVVPELSNPSENLWVFRAELKTSDGLVVVQHGHAHPKMVTRGIFNPAKRKDKILETAESRAMTRAFKTLFRIRFQETFLDADDLEGTDDAATAYKVGGEKPASEPAQPFQTTVQNVRAPQQTTTATAKIEVPTLPFPTTTTPTEGALAASQPIAQAQGGVPVAEDKPKDNAPRRVKRTEKRVALLAALEAGIAQKGLDRPTLVGAMRRKYAATGALTAIPEQDLVDYLPSEAIESTVAWIQAKPDAGTPTPIAGPPIMADIQAQTHPMIPLASPEDAARAAARRPQVEGWLTKGIDKEVLQRVIRDIVGTSIPVRSVNDTDWVRVAAAMDEKLTATAGVTA